MRWPHRRNACHAFWSDGCADKPAKQSAEERRSDFAPAVRAERAVVAIVAVVVTVLRLMVARWRRRGRAAHHLVPWRVAHRSGMRFRWPSCRCLCHVLGRCRSLGDASLLHRRFHCRGRPALRRRIAFRSRECRAAKRSAHGESQHHLLYCLVHCRVPFVV